MKNEQIQHLIKIFSFVPPLPSKIRQKKQNFLLNLPLFTTIYQKKGQQNFNIIVNHITIKKFQFGDTILQNYPQNDQQQQQDRAFNYIIKGTVMMFTTKNNRNTQAQFYKKLTTNQYFGQKLHFNNDILYEVKAVSPCVILQLDLITFYNTFSGHFQYAELKDKVIFLQKIWIFNDMGRINIERILLMSESVKIKKNTILFEKGQSTQHFYIIISGQLALFQNYNDQKVKYVPFCLLSRSQICGLEQIALQTNYQYNGRVSSQFLQVLIINKQTFIKHIQPYIIKFYNTIRTMYEQKLKLKQKSIKYDKQYKQVCEYSRKKQKDIFAFFLKKFIPPKNNKVIMQKVQINKSTQLKDKCFRQIKLKQIKTQQDRTFSQKRISILTNHNYTKDKKLLINYLMKKQKRHQKLYQSQMKFQKTIQENPGVVEKINVKKSIAVKNQKRKLVQSRNRTVSSIY